MKKIIFGCILIILGLCFPYIYSLLTNISIISIISIVLLLIGIYICFKETYPVKNIYQVESQKKDNKK